MAAPISENPIIVDLSETCGCLLIGAFLSCALWGVTTLQAFLYFSRYQYKSDGWSRTCLVTILWLINTANEVLVIEAVWSILIPRYGSILSLGETRPTLMHHGWVAQIVELSVQLFFIHRIYLFNGKKWIVPLILAVLSIYQLVIIIPYDVFVYGSGASTGALESKKATSMVLALRSVTAADDIAIAGSMMYYVLRQGTSEYQETRRVIYRLLLVTANTGFWTAILAIVELSLVAKFPTGLQFMVVEGPLCSLYLSSLLACLNTRGYVREGRNGEPDFKDTPSGLAKGTRSREVPVLLRPFKHDGTSTSGTGSSTMIKIETGETRYVDCGLNDSQGFPIKGARELTAEHV